MDSGGWWTKSNVQGAVELRVCGHSRWVGNELILFSIVIGDSEVDISNVFESPLLSYGAGFLSHGVIVQYLARLHVYVIMCVSHHWLTVAFVMEAFVLSEVRTLVYNNHFSFQSD